MAGSRRSRGPVIASLLAATVSVVGCGSSSSPTTPTASPTPAPEPSPTSLHVVSGLVFYDENGNGVRDDSEHVLLPQVGVTIGGRTAASDGDGRFTITDVPAGTRTASVNAPSLPPFFQAGRATSLAVPPSSGFLLTVPVALPIQGNRPNVYMAFGDSITEGDGSRGRRGYRDDLAHQLRGYWGEAEVVKEGVTATRSSDGAARLGASLAAVHPAYALIVYGTNDWNSFVCRHVAECFTLSSMRSMIREARAAGTVPVVATLLPVNPASSDPLAAARNAWVIETNSQLRPLVREEGGVLADVHTAFMDEARDNLPALFSDHVHPNDRGYGVMADELFRAITRPVGTGMASNVLKR